MLSQPGKQTYATHIFPNISRSNDRQTLKFGKLIEYNMKNIFLEKPCLKYGRETIPRPFSKKSKLGISLDQQSKKMYSLLLLYIHGKVYENILKRRCWPLALTLYKAFSAWFLKRNIFLVIFDKLAKFHCQVAFTSWDNEQYVYCNWLLARSVT